MKGHPLYCRAKISGDPDDYLNDSWIPENYGDWIEGYYFKLVEDGRYIHLIVPSDYEANYPGVMFGNFLAIDPETLELHNDINGWIPWKDVDKILGKR